MKSLIVLSALALIVYHLGAGLYHLVHDRSGERVLQSLTRRIAFSVGLLLLVLAGIASGLIQPHGLTG
jgi:succinate dehydrogenase/fumarate reductase cytochrome b subunit